MNIQAIFLQEKGLSRYLRIGITLLFISFLFSCNKSKDPATVNNNEVKATVTFPSGSPVIINATGSKALLGNSLLGGGTYVDGTNAANQAVYITVYSTGTNNVTQPGTYSFSCQYRPDATTQLAPIYLNFGANPGSITFTTINDHYMEGSFNSVCRYGMDSVIIAGTFKGDHLTH